MLSGSVIPRWTRRLYSNTLCGLQACVSAILSFAALWYPHGIHNPLARNPKPYLCETSFTWHLQFEPSQNQNSRHHAAGSELPWSRRFQAEGDFEWCFAHVRQ